MDHATQSTFRHAGNGHYFDLEASHRFERLVSLGQSDVGRTFELSLWMCQTPRAGLKAGSHHREAGLGSVFPSPQRSLFPVGATTASMGIGETTFMAKDSISSGRGAWGEVADTSDQGGRGDCAQRASGRGTPQQQLAVSTLLPGRVGGGQNVLCSSWPTDTGPSGQTVRVSSPTNRRPALPRSAHVGGKGALCVKPAVDHLPADLLADFPSLRLRTSPNYNPNE